MSMDWTQPIFKQQPDIVEMLHEWCEEDHTDHDNCIHCVAANEIERLREVDASRQWQASHALDEIERLRTQVEDLRRYCATGETP